MKYIKKYNENIDIDWNDFDFEEENENDYNNYLSDYDKKYNSSSKIYYLLIKNPIDFINIIENNGFKLIYHTFGHNDRSKWDLELSDIKIFYFILWYDKKYSILTNTNEFDIITTNKEIINYQI